MRVSKIGMPRQLSPILAPVALLIGTGLAQTPDAVIRSSVREVLLEVSVRDAHGRLITNLKPGEVTVYEDGVRQDVRAFRLVAGSEVRAEDVAQSASPAPIPDVSRPLCPTAAPRSIPCAP